ncbi:hypothetical protein PENTCL1PPCAC_26220, partial [Pristionchus entomophagus]
QGMTRVFLLLSLVGIVGLVWAHSHSEPAHYKYSKEANEVVYEEEEHGHVHSHGHAHDDHGHSKICFSHNEVDHGHAHEAHGHAQGHHGHSHEGGECPYAKAAREEREA